jgi:hypothetical protein
MTSVEELNVDLRLFLQLCTLAALAYLGFRTGGSLSVSVILAIALPLLAGLVWARCVALNGKWRLADPMRLGLETLYFISGMTALVASGATTLAVLLLAAVAVHYFITLRFRLR